MGRRRGRVFGAWSSFRYPYRMVSPRKKASQRRWYLLHQERLLANARKYYAAHRGAVLRRQLAKRLFDPIWRDRANARSHSWKSERRIEWAQARNLVLS